MGVHDWSRVSPNHFHHFHGAWINHLSEELNDGVLPDGYYALAEQSQAIQPDILTVDVLPSVTRPDPSGSNGTTDPGGVGMMMKPAAATKVRRFSPPKSRTVAIRQTDTGELRSIVEIVSPGNKDSTDRLNAFVLKCQTALKYGVQLAVIDLLPPTRICPSGTHARIIDDTADFEPDRPLYCVGYQADPPGPDASYVSYYDPLAVGETLPETPLFLTPDQYVPLPLPKTYESAYVRLPGIIKDALEVG